MLPGVEADSKNERHWLVAIFLQLGLRLRYLYESWFFIRPLFMGLSAYKSNFRPKNAPDYDFVTIWGFTWIWILAGLSRDGSSILYGILCKLGIMNVINNIHGWLSDRLAAQFEKAGFNGSEREVPIPEYDWKNGNPQEFYNLFVKKPHPVILRGFMNDTQLLKDLSWDTILSKYGDEDVFLTRRELDGYAGKLREVENPQVYLHNSEKLFNKYPVIRTLFQYHKLEPYLNMKIGYEQLFVGKQGTGTPFHNAAVFNMFYMIDGQKKWWFVDPYDTFLPTQLFSSDVLPALSDAFSRLITTRRLSHSSNTAQFILPLSHLVMSCSILLGGGTLSRISLQLPPLLHQDGTQMGLSVEPVWEVKRIMISTVSVPLVSSAESPLGNFSTVFFKNPLPNSMNIPLCVKQITVLFISKLRLPIKVASRCWA